NLRQQAHRLDVIAMLLEELAHDRLSLIGLPFGKQTGRRDDSRRQSSHVPRKLVGLVSLGATAYRPQKLGEGAPTRRQGSVVLNRTLISLDRSTRLPDSLEAMAPFLKQTPVTRMQLLELLQSTQGIGNPAQVPLTDGDEIQHIAILGNLGPQ